FRARFTVDAANVERARADRTGGIVPPVEEDSAPGPGGRGRGEQRGGPLYGQQCLDHCRRQPGAHRPAKTGNPRHGPRPVPGGPSRLPCVASSFLWQFACVCRFGMGPRETVLSSTPISSAIVMLVNRLASCFHSSFAVCTIRLRNSHFGSGKRFRRPELF